MSSATSRSSSTTSTRPDDRVAGAGMAFTPRSVDRRSYRTMTPELTLPLPLRAVLARRPMIALEKIVQPRARAGQRPVRWRHINAEIAQSAGGGGPREHGAPNAGLVDHLTASDEQIVEAPDDAVAQRSERFEPEAIVRVVGGLGRERAQRPAQPARGVGRTAEVDRDLGQR